MSKGLTSRVRELCDRITTIDEVLVGTSYVHAVALAAPVVVGCVTFDT